MDSIKYFVPWVKHVWRYLNTTDGFTFGVKVGETTTYYTGYKPDRPLSLREYAVFFKERDLYVGVAREIKARHNQ